ncbi:MAG: biotin-dependent carboxyltransferase family protein [Saprospiraceae bacterium]|nr:biotin-dependent carboxyltransferase family protein [Saprospiraceae bacterium]
MRLSLQIKTSGALATLQDGGFATGRSFGIPVGGAADNWSHRLANILLQNRDELTTLEIAGGFFSAKVHGSGWLAAAGTGGFLYLNGKHEYHNRPVKVHDGDELEIRPESSGCYTYLSVKGGWEAQRVFNREGTCLAAGFGGFKGRAMQPGDRLFAAQSFDVEILKPGLNWRIKDVFFSDLRPIRVMAGPEFHENHTLLFEQPYCITHRRNRMGVRLTATTPLSGAHSGSMISVLVAPGIIQAPPDGQLFVLFADAQTTGGYPRIAQVIAADLPRLAQMPSGTNVRFRQVDLLEAEAALKKTEDALAKIRTATRLHSLFLPPDDI